MVNVTKKQIAAASLIPFVAGAGISTQVQPFDPQENITEDNPVQNKSVEKQVEYNATLYRNSSRPQCINTSQLNESYTNMKGVDELLC